MYNNRQKSLIIQPGKLGDILITAPIAKYYKEQGYDVEWPVFHNFYTTIQRFEYVKPVSFEIEINSNKYYSLKRANFLDKDLNEQSSKMFENIYSHISANTFDLIIDPCFSFPGHRNEYNNQKPVEYHSKNLNWINLKYDLAKVPLQERWNLEYNRDIERERKLFNFIKDFCYKKYGSYEYSIVHSYTRVENYFDKLKIKNPINFSYIKGFEIFDWLMVLEHSNKIVCCDSSLCNFVEVSNSLRDKEKYYLGSEELHYHSYMRNILLNNWNNLTTEDISYGKFKI